MPINLYSPYINHITGSWRGLALAACLNLTACAQLPLQKPTSLTDNAAVRPSASSTYQDEFQVSGRISISYEQNGKPQNLPAGFNWRQHQRNFTLQLNNQLGQTQVEIVQSQAGVSLRQPGKPLLEAATLDELLQQNLGWSLPSQSLAYWLQGFVRQPQGLQKLEPVEQTLQTEGWQLRFINWDQQRPKRLDLQRYTEQTGQLSMRIIIQEWNQSE